jgi:mannose-6-phosphate isomerase-like protein (cupin superfamily)
MNRLQAKAAFATLVFTGFVGSIFVQGCATDRRSSVMSSGKVLVMDLNTNPDYQQLLDGKAQTFGMRSGRVYLQPGESCGQHSTEAHEELLVFLSGAGVALIGEEQTPYEVGAGKVFYIPPHTTHNNRNTGTEPLVYIYCVAPVDSRN